MNFHQFIEDRNSKMKEEYNALRPETKSRKERLEKLAAKYQVSTSTVHDAIYRSKSNSAKPKA